MEELEAESIEIIREAAASARHPVMLDAADARSSVMLHLARKAFHPAPPPFATRPGAAPGAEDLDVILDARAAQRRTGAKESDAPPCSLYNTRVAPGQALRVLPLSRWTEADVLDYVKRESIAIDAAHAGRTHAMPEQEPAATASSARVLSCGSLDDRGPAHIARVLSGPMPVPGSFRMPVQLVLHTDAGFRGFAGRIASGRVRVGDAIRVLPSGITSRIKALVRGLHAPTACEAGESVTLALMDDIDVTRGDVIAAADDPPEAADQFETRVLWLDEHPMVSGRSYFLKIHAREVSAQVTAIKYREDPAGAHLAARQLGRDEIGVVNVSTSHAVVFEPYAKSRALGSFILIDKLTLRTVGVGTIDFALRRAANLHWQSLDVHKQARAQAKHQRPRCIWLTGLSGSGKSTLANLLEKRLHAQGRHTYLLDGDNVRHGLNRDLGFTEADRVENIRRVAEVARLMVDAGLVVIVSFISPFRAERRVARALFEPGEFIEVYVDTPLEECERRDPKGLYAKARRGELANFTGIDSPYEPPEAPEVHVKTEGAAPEDGVREIIERL